MRDSCRDLRVQKGTEPKLSRSDPNPVGRWHRPTLCLSDSDSAEHTAQPRQSASGKQMRLESEPPARRDTTRSGPPVSAIPLGSTARSAEEAGPDPAAPDPSHPDRAAGTPDLAV